MSKSTFHKLNPDKKKRILRACLKEFSKNSFGEASVSSIVKELGIAKGSIYQYFEDKEDLYTYVIERSADRKYEILNFAAQRAIASWQQWFFQTCLVEIKFTKEFPEMAQLIRRELFHGNSFLQKKESDFTRTGLTNFQAELSNAMDMVNLVFLVSSMKNAIVSRYAGVRLTDKTSMEINTLSEQIARIVTSWS